MTKGIAGESVQRTIAGPPQRGRAHHQVHPGGTRRSDQQQQWLIYVVRTVDDTLYTGVATDVDRRYVEHCSGGAKSAKYLRAHLPEALVFRKRIGERPLALKVEYWFKQLTKAEKERVVARGKLRFDREGRIERGCYGR